MIVGFTGTRRGLSTRQFDTMCRLLSANSDLITLGVHGDCKGADAAFDAQCKRLGIRRAAFPGHDGTGQSPWRAYCDADEIGDPLPYLKRNRLIVDTCRWLIAGPESMVRRGGTWQTVNYARRTGRIESVTIIHPDGTLLNPTYRQRSPEDRVSPT